MFHSAVMKLQGSVVKVERNTNQSVITIAVNRQEHSSYFRVFVHGKLKDEIMFLCKKTDSVIVQAHVVQNDKGIFFNINNLHDISIFPHTGNKELQNRFQSLNQAGI